MHTQLLHSHIFYILYAVLISLSSLDSFLSSLSFVYHCLIYIYIFTIPIFNSINRRMATPQHKCTIYLTILIFIIPLQQLFQTNKLQGVQFNLESNRNSEIRVKSDAIVTFSLAIFTRKESVPLARWKKSDRSGSLPPPRVISRMKKIGWRAGGIN